MDRITYLLRRIGELTANYEARLMDKDAVILDLKSQIETLDQKISEGWTEG
jgi:hypothetical protein